MQKEDEHAEARARAELQANNHPHIEAAVDKVTAENDISTNASGKENKSNAANLPTGRQLHQLPAPGSYLRTWPGASRTKCSRP